MSKKWSDSSIRSSDWPYRGTGLAEVLLQNKAVMLLASAAAWQWNAQRQHGVWSWSKHSFPQEETFTETALYFEVRSRSCKSSFPGWTHSTGENLQSLKFTVNFTAAALEDLKFKLRKLIQRSGCSPSHKVRKNLEFGTFVIEKLAFASWTNGACLTTQKANRRRQTEGEQSRRWIGNMIVKWWIDINLPTNWLLTAENA